MTTVLHRRVDSVSKKMDKIFGVKGTLYHEPSYSLNLETGTQTLSTQGQSVILRKRPITYNERARLSSAGFTEVSVAWDMRAAHITTDVEPGDLITTGGFHYEVVPGGATLDELGVDWCIYARRKQ